MDKISLVGLTLGIAAIVIGQVLEGGHISSLVQPTAFLIVIGGTLGAVMLQSPLRSFVEGMRMARWVFVPPAMSSQAVIEQVENWSHVARKEGLLTLENLTAVANDLGHKDVPSLYVAIGDGQVGAQSVVEKLVQLHGGEEETADTVTEDVVVTRRRRPFRDGAHILVDGDDSMQVKLAKCCYPLPGDEIIGFVTKTDGVSVHRADCSNVPALKKEPERIVPVSWADGEASATFVVTIQIEGLDRARLLSDVSSALSEQHLDILSVNISTNKHRQFSGKFTFESQDPTHLQHVLNQVRRVPGVYDVYRVAG